MSKPSLEQVFIIGGAVLMGLLTLLLIVIGILEATR